MLKERCNTCGNEAVEDTGLCIDCLDFAVRYKTTC